MRGEKGRERGDKKMRVEREDRRGKREERKWHMNVISIFNALTVILISFNYFNGINYGID